MPRSWLVIPALLAVATACESGRVAPQRRSPPAPAPASAAEAKPERPVQTYGAPLAGAPAASLSAVLAAPGDFTGRPLQVEGHVRRACSKMGCWMELSTSSEPEAPACRVIMKGHSFFVPKDSAGATARVEGTLEHRVIPAAQVLHMEEEGGSFPRKAADGSAEEVRFVASGVELRRGS